LSQTRQTAARSTDPDDYQDVPRPVALLARDVGDHHTTSWHSHKRAQLVFATSGVMVVRTRQGAWVIPPQRAVWVPAGMEHETETIGQVAMRTVYVEAAAARRLARQCCAVNVSPLLRELILRAATLPVLYARRRPEARIMQMILDEIRESSMLPLHLPVPSHQRLANICNAILRDPRCHHTLAQLARHEGMSKRTAERLFAREVAMTFSRWRQQARLLAALTRLAAGKSVKQAAFESGYSSQSAFTSTFKRTFGTTPRQYFSAAR
jgi:AraC-like DNA-binding protein/mannose-6-phosphate isomerase-like protein (cupin superfamily)